MSAPPLLLGAVLIFWGWQTSHLVWSSFLAALLELPRIVTFRLNWGHRQHCGIWDLTTLMLSAALIFAFASWPLSEAVWIFLQWLPILFFPVVAIACYCRQPGLKSPVFLWLLRNQPAPTHGFTTINPAYAYFAITLLAASATNLKGEFFYWGCCVFLAWMFWARRPRRTVVWIAAPIFLVLCLASRQIHQEWRQFQLSNANAWINSPNERDFEDASAFVFLNRIPDLKSSGRVVLELKPAAAGNPPPRLRVATYNLMAGSAWIAKGRNQDQPALWTNGMWELLPGEPPALHQASVSALFPKGSGLLALPFGTGRITDLPALDLQRTGNGIVRAEEVPEAARFMVHYGWPHGWDTPPQQDQDFDIPLRELPALDQVIADLDLSSKKPEEVLTVLRNYFATAYRYSLNPRRIKINALPTETPLTRFLQLDHEGHCEHFASAAVLILRRIGIPARYATGYAVPPQPRNDGVYVIRDRHAHAWALAYVQGAWIDYDPTPSGWLEWETQQRSWWAGLGDRLAKMRFGFAFWKWDNQPTTLVAGILALIAGLVIWMAWRLIRSRTSSPPAAPSHQESIAKFRDGQDSEWFLIEQFLATKGLTRPPGETSQEWMRRLETLETMRDEIQFLRPALQLHYQYRFDPKGLPAADRGALARQARAWLQKHEKRPG